MNNPDDWPDPLDSSPDGGAEWAADQGRPPSPRWEPPPLASSTTAKTMVGVAAGIGIIVRLVVVRSNIDAYSVSALAYLLGSSLIFVAVPALLAVLLARRPTAATSMGRTLTGVTFGLLLIAMVVGEGAICVALASPLVYGVAAAVTAIRGEVDNARGRNLVVALLLLPAMEIGMVEPVQEVTVDRIVAADLGSVEDALTAAPDLIGTPPPWLLTLGLPLPDAASVSMESADLAVWVFSYGDRGATTMVMTSVAPGTWDFEVNSDMAPTRRFMTWHGGRLTATPVGDHVEVTMTLAFDPALNPDWWFGRVERPIVAAFADHLLDAMGLLEVTR